MQKISTISKRLIENFIISLQCVIKEGTLLRNESKIPKNGDSVYKCFIVFLQPLRVENYY